MKKMMKCLALAIMVLTVAGTAWSWDFADHVKAAPGGQGDFLIYPYYLAMPGGWETKIWVVNTAPNRSVIAHIAFYSARTSREMLDFFLFLTPTDVWSGTIRYNTTTSTVEVFSTDDSAMISAGVFASPATPLTKSFTSPLGATCVGTPELYKDMLGYVKVVEQAHSDANSNAYIYPRGGSAKVDLNSPPVSKLALYEAFNDFMAAAAVPGTPPQAKSGSNVLVMDGMNVLTGYMEFRNPTTGQDTTINATVLRDYDNQTPTGYGQSFGFYTNCTGIQGATPPAGVGCQAGTVTSTTTGVISPFVCANGATSAACACATNGAGCQTNSIGEVEAALAKDWVSMPYNAKTATLHFLTFPTKQTVRDSIDCYYVSSPSPFFSKAAKPATLPHPSTYASSWDSWGCFGYQSLNYDTSENSSSVTSIFSPSTSLNNLCGEVNWAAGFAFDEGWAVYNFGSSFGASYTTPFDLQANINSTTYDAWYSGAPVIGSVLYFGSNGLTTLPASYADGKVAYSAGTGLPATTDVVYYNYQYWDLANNLGYAGGGAAPLPYNYDADETGCYNTGTPVACGTVYALTTGAHGFNTIYNNKFTGNRPVILANATMTTQKAMNVFVPAGTTITLTAAANFAAVRAPYAAIVGVVGANAVANDTMVTIPAGTTITSTADLTDIANMPQ